MGVLTFVVLFYEKLFVACSLCVIYVGGDNDFNVQAMITRLMWTIWTSLSAVRERPLNLITHSLTPVGYHDDVIKWKHFPRYWPFVWGIHRSPVNSAHKGQWRGALMFSLICVWTNGWVNNRDAGDLRRHRAHYDVTVMILTYCASWLLFRHTYVGWKQKIVTLTTFSPLMAP